MTGPAPDDARARKERLNPKRALSLKMAVTTRQMHKRFDQSVAAIGITRSQWTLVAVVSGRPGVTQREAAELLEMSEAAAGRLIERLCSDGLLVRKPKEDDRRAYCLNLTEAAGALLERISGVAALYEETLYAGFTPEDLARLDGYLDKLAANVAAER